MCAVSSTSTRFVVAALLLAILVPSSAVAEPWARPDESVVASASAFTSFASKQYSIRGKTFDLLDAQADGKVSTFGVDVDAELTLIERLSLYWRATAQSVTLDTPFSTASVSGFGDVLFGARWQLSTKPFQIAVSLDGKFPTGYTADPGAFLPTLGNGVDEGQALLQVGKRFSFPVFAWAAAGYRLRGARPSGAGGQSVDYADQVPYDVHVGVGPFKKFTLLGLVDGVFSLGSTEPLESITFHPPSESYLRVGPGLRYRFARRARVAASWLTTLSGNDTFKLQYFSLSIEGIYGL